MAGTATRIFAKRTASTSKHVIIQNPAVSAPYSEEKPVMLPFLTPQQIRLEYNKEIRRLDKGLWLAEKKRKKLIKDQMEHQTRVKNLIENVVCGDSGRSRLIPVGSLATGLSMGDSSDFDFCLIPKDAEFYKDFFHNHNFKRVFMDSVMELLAQLHRHDPDLAYSQDPFPLYRARVPLICCYFISGLSIDVQFPDENFHAIRNTNLIRHYCAADPRFGLLYMYVRTVFNRLGVRNSKDGLLSSYHILLLVVHFLQSRTAPPVLPVLNITHNDKVGKLPSNQLIDWKSENKSSVGELAVEFMEYYSTLDTQTTAIQIRYGRTVKKRQLPGDTRLLMYDPYSNITVARGPKISDTLKIGSTYLYNRMCRGMYLDTFPEFPEANDFKLLL
ncbi:unnamed protein product [Bursaphelenchus okinawaensis]|uniref:PAP-associated domain-containing protein n=1 Tax=Bursaphelenchus okinawaensis TaxID=465554 RepID=A0A811L8G0_9BILA|nr:unnamed protein product [Bursaphelenchus okinawaensis]CAG9118908.1 unnamed protein product [Bursaphelenchus okinawaensis]